MSCFSEFAFPLFSTSIFLVISFICLVFHFSGSPSNIKYQIKVEMLTPTMFGKNQRRGCMVKTDHCRLGWSSSILTSSPPLLLLTFLFFLYQVKCFFFISLWSYKATKLQSLIIVSLESNGDMNLNFAKTIPDGIKKDACTLA